MRIIVMRDAATVVRGGGWGGCEVWHEARECDACSLMRMRKSNGWWLGILRPCLPILQPIVFIISSP